MIDGIDMPLMPGTTLSLGTNDTADIRWTWLAAPNGLGDFFAVIGRQRSAGEAAPPPMARQADMLEIERRLGFAPPSDLQAS